MESFRIGRQLDPTDVDVAAIDRGLHSYNQRAADLASIRRFACYAKSSTLAIECGCRLLYLDTFSFQAPEFYYRLGYETACRLDGFPDGGSKFILRKSWVS